jgi:single-strand DNA-binding protein
MAFAKVMLIGNLGRDPEMRYTPSGRPVTEFSVAVSHRGRDAQSGDWVDQGTDWYRVTIWGDRGERAAEQLRKGNRVFVEGRFRTREYEARDGQKRISLEVTADNVISLERGVRDEGDAPAFAADARPSDARPAAGVSPIRRGPPEAAPEPPGYGDLDDLPF